MAMENGKFEKALTLHKLISKSQSEIDMWNEIISGDDFIFTLECKGMCRGRMVYPNADTVRMIGRQEIKRLKALINELDKEFNKL